MPVILLRQKDAVSSIYKFLESGLNMARSRIWSAFEILREITICTAVLLSIPGASWGADTARSKETQACTGDAFKFCGFDIPNEKKIAACLEAHREKLTPACQAMFPEPKTPSKEKTQTSGHRKG